MAKEHKVKIVNVDPEEIKVYLDGKLVGSANYDDHGSSGLWTVESMALSFAEAMGAKVKVIKDA